MAENVVEFISKLKKGLNVDLMICGKFLGKIYIRRKIFQGDSISPL